MRHGGWEEERRVQAGQPDVLVSEENPRYVWKPSPDTEEIRRHLLNLLDSLFEHMSRDRYPIGAGLGETIIRQLGDATKTPETGRNGRQERGGTD